MHSKNKMVIVSLLLTVLAAGASFASAEKPRFNCTHWLPAVVTVNLELIPNETYCANETVVVPTNVTLKIPAGVVILLDQKCSIVVKGTFKAEGTTENSVVLSSLQNPNHLNVYSTSNKPILFQA